MKYIFETDIDCEACLDNVLLELLKHTGDNGLYFFSDKSGYKIIIDSTEELESLEELILSREEVEVKIINEKIIDETEFQKLKVTFTPYTKSFWN